MIATCLPPMTPRRGLLWGVRRRVRCSLLLQRRRPPPHAAAAAALLHSGRRLASPAQELKQHGAAWPVPVLSAAEAAELKARLLAETAFEASFATSDLMYYKSHLVFSAVDALARNPKVVKAAQQALGTQDLLLWDSSVPLKPPTEPGGTPAIFPMHQDGTYWGLEPVGGAVSCWVALSDASQAAGCMRVVRGSHKSGQLPHSLQPDEPGSMLRRGQQVDGVSDADGEPMELQAGEMSMHHPLALHCSGANTTADTRVGVVLVPSQCVRLHMLISSVSVSHARTHTQEDDLDSTTCYPKCM